MQGNWERCGVCGAKLPSQPAGSQAGESTGALPADRSALISLALYALAITLGIILIGVVCVLLLQLIL